MAQWIFRFFLNRFPCLVSNNEKVNVANSRNAIARNKVQA